MGKRFVLISVMLIVSSAVHLYAGQKQYAPFEFKRHEVSLSGAFFPGHYTLGHYRSGLYDMYDISSVKELYDSYEHYLKEYITNAWSLKYTHNFTGLLAMSVSVSYEGGWNRLHRIADDSIVAKEYNHFITPMLHFRVHWLNRRNVRMYSDLAAGVSLHLSGKAKAMFAGQFTAVGVTFGRRFFGFVECGAGSVYIGGCAGIGYRF